MKYLVALLLLASYFNLAEFHPIDEIIVSEIADFTKDSSDYLTHIETKGYDGDLVSVSVENKGDLSEYIGFQVYLPEQVDLLEFNSKLSGPRVKPLKRNISENSPLQLDSLIDDETLVHDVQTASTRTFISGSNEITFNLNYLSEDSKDSKLTNQFLSVLDLYSQHPEHIRVKLKSANFAHGKYPDSVKHRWLVRAHPGHSLLVNFEEVDVEKGADQVTVYDVQSGGTKRLVGEVTVAKQLKVLSNEMMVVFESDCTIGRGGFSAVVTAVRDDVNTTTEAPTCGTPEETENGYYVVSDGDVIAKEGVNVTYHCNENYTMADHSNVTLQCFDGSFEPSFADSNIYCIPDPIWSEWEEGVCSKACLGGSRTDKRVCIHGNCEGASEIIVDCNDRTCKEAATTCGSGVQSKSKIADSQLSASSYFKLMATNHHFHHGRLFGLTGVAAWVAGSRTTNEWIQIDYLDQVEITGVATQGRGNGEVWQGYDQWVTQYTVSYKNDENGAFQFVTDENGATILFPGNYDKETVVANQFPSTIKARYFRINPTVWHEYISLRLEFLTC